MRLRHHSVWGLPLCKNFIGFFKVNFHLAEFNLAILGVTSGINAVEKGDTDVERSQLNSEQNSSAVSSNQRHHGLGTDRRLYKSAAICTYRIEQFVFA